MMMTLKYNKNTHTPVNLVSSFIICTNNLSISQTRREFQSFFFLAVCAIFFLRAQRSVHQRRQNRLAQKHGYDPGLLFKLTLAMDDMVRLSLPAMQTKQWV